MALNRFVIDGYGQVELNNVAFRRDGRIEAQCALDATDFKDVPAENGMLLCVDRLNRTIKYRTADSKLPVGLNYTAEHMYDERTPGLKNFKLETGTFLPRIGLLAVGDKWTTNCLSYDTSDFADDATLVTALAAIKTTPIYATAGTDGTVLLSKTAATEGPVLQVVEKTTMPDGQLGVMLQVLSV